MIGELVTLVVLLTAAVRSNGQTPFPGESKQAPELRPFQTKLVAAFEPSAAERHSLQQAITGYAARTVRDDLSAWDAFLAEFPNGAWAAAVHVGLGGECFTYGRYSLALLHWNQGWELAGENRGTPVRGLADHAVAELALMYARLGRREDLRQLLGSIAARPIGGGSSVRLKNASEGLATMDYHPEVAYRCGPLALSRVLAHIAPGRETDERIRSSRSTESGFSLWELAQLSAELGMNYQMAFRKKGALVILPAVVHWNVGHYAALLKERRGLHLAEDPTFHNQAWLSGAALDAEASGYFLVPPGPLPPGWRAVAVVEGNRVLGKGTTSDSDPDATNLYDATAYPRDQSCGAATWNVGLLLINQIITDTPVGYAPPLGPAMHFTATYNSLDQGIGSAAYEVPSMGFLWSHNWLSFLMEERLNELAMLHLYAPGGGTLRFFSLSETNGSFYNQFYGRGTLWRVSSNRFEYRFSHGAKWVYAQPDGSVGATRRLFLSEVHDPAGNAARLEYDSDLRLMRLIDAIGQETTFTYRTGTRAAERFRIEKVTDPFGRSAHFAYDWVGFLTNITDVLGLNSGLVYGGPYFDALRSLTNTATFTITVSSGGGRPGSGSTGGSAFYYRFVDGIAELHTPYGITRFRRGYGSNSQVWMEVTGPDGLTERFEYNESNRVRVEDSEPLRAVPRGMGTQNAWLYARNSYHWDKKAFAEGYRADDYRGARIYHFTHGLDLRAASPIIESIKLPLENRVWYNYPGQASSAGAVVPWFAGRSDRPSRIGRVLDDGTTQLYQFEYNAQQNVTKFIDPAGREFTYLYAEDGVDLVEVRQTRAGKNELLGRSSYNARHLPTAFTDAAGQTTTFGYNARGQLTSFTNALQEVTTLEYDPAGYLTAIDGPLPGSSDRKSLSYDRFGRVRTATGVDGYTLVFEYDVLDRLTKVTYPDGIFESIDYDRLHVRNIRDRGGRATEFEFDAMRRPISLRDALGRVTRFDWCACRALAAVIDPLGRMTSWRRDLQGRVINKVHPDGSQSHYAYEPESGRLARITDEQGQVTILQYNVDGTLREKSYSAARIPTPAVKFFYDPDYLRLIAFEDGQGRTTLGFHAVADPPTPGAGLLASVDGPLPDDVVRYDYDPLDRLVARSVNGVGSRLSFDVLGRQTRLENALGSFQYHWVGATRRLERIAFPNGQETQFQYLGVSSGSLIQKIVNTGPGGSLLSQFEYGYDAARRVTNWVKDLGALGRVAWFLTYDAEDRLVRASDAVGGGFEYGYDAASNLIQDQEAGSARQTTFNALDQPVSLTASIPEATYQWDAEHRLVAIVQGTRRSEFYYDALDRRVRMVEKNNGAVTSDRRYVWCGPDLSEERDASGARVLKRFFTHGEQWLEPINSVGVGVYFYTTDHLGSVRQLVSSAGLVLATFEYTPYGKQIISTGTAQPSFAFAGQFLHPPSGHLLTWFRAYDPELKRWLSHDPAGGSLGENLYAYANGNPINRTDPFGLQSNLSKLPGNSYSQQIQEGVDGYKNAKNVAKTVESVVEKGIKEAAKDKFDDFKNDKLDEAKKSMGGSAREEQERLWEEAKKTSEKIDPFGKLAGKHFGTATDQLAGCPTPSPTKTPPKPERAPAPEPSWVDGILTALGIQSSPAEAQPTIQDSMRRAQQEKIGAETKANAAY